MSGRYVSLDLEQGSLTLDDLQRLVEAARDLGASPLDVFVLQDGILSLELPDE